MSKLPHSTRGRILNSHPSPSPSPDHVTLADLPLPELQDDRS